MRFVTRVAIVLVAVVAVSVLAALAWDKSDARAQQATLPPAAQH